MEREVLVVESALFSAAGPLSVREISDATGIEDGSVRRALKKLVSLYKNRETSIEIVRVGGKYIMQVKPEYAEEAREVAPTEIEPEMLKTLVLIAYYQPITQSRIVEMRGHGAYAHIKELAAMGLITARARGRTKVLKTTKKFLERFNIDARTPEDIKEFLESGGYVG